MTILGIRCSSSDFSYVFLTETRDAPRLLEAKTIAYPSGYSRGQSLKWLYQEIEDLLGRHHPNAIVMKGAEGNAPRDKSFVVRVEHEAVIFLVAANRGIKNVQRKVKSTIAKDLGLKGKGKYLVTLDSSSIPNYSELHEKIQEAVLAARSELH